MANTSKRGFASMEGDKQRTIASKGGKAAHAKGTAHEWTSDEARAAGRKGGESRGTRIRPDEMVAHSAEERSSGRALAGSYNEHTLASNFLSNAGRSLRTPAGMSDHPVTSGEQRMSDHPAHVANPLEPAGSIPYSITASAYQHES